MTKQSESEATREAKYRAAKDAIENDFRFLVNHYSARCGRAWTQQALLGIITRYLKEELNNDD